MSLTPPDGAAPGLSHAPVPVVFIDVHTPSVAPMPRVIGNDRAGAAVAARHLIGLGHRRIAFMGDALQDPFGFTTSRDREGGFREELSIGGISVPPWWTGHGAHGRYEARELALRILREDDRPTAIFAASDTQAFGVIAAARELGLHVPEDLSVIGYDDIEAADYVGLTTIRQRLFESGRRGAEMLLREIDQRSEEPPIDILTPELVVRATTAPPKEGRA
jgi:DNA-binding LacI/PurR family transcriptional regulator